MDLTTRNQTTTIPPTIIPKHFEWSNYAKVFAQAPFARYFLNTFITASVTTIVSLFNALLGAFAMVNLKFKGKGVVQMVLLSLLMVPGEAIIFTNYNTIARMGLLNLYWFGIAIFNFNFLHVLLAKLLRFNLTDNL